MLMAVGFSLMYATARFFNVAHGIIFTSAAYTVFLLTSHIGLPLFVASVIALALSGLIGCLLELSIYRPLRRRSASALILLISSLGIYIALQNVISLAFGDDTKTIRPGMPRQGIAILGANMTTVQVLTVWVSVVLGIGLAVFLKKTKMGKSIRAVSNDRSLAELSGIESDRVFLVTFAIASVLAALAGILVSLDVDMTPTMGMAALMMAVVAVIIGGIGSIPGTALGALLLATAQHFGIWKVGSHWREAITFVILLAFLLFRPQGFFGKKVRKAAV